MTSELPQIEILLSFSVFIHVRENNCCVLYQTLWYGMMMTYSILAICYTLGYTNYLTLLYAVDCFIHGIIVLSPNYYGTGK